MDSNDMKPHTFSGADWQTERRSLAQLLFTLDGMQTFVYGMEAGGAMILGSAIGFGNSDSAMDETDQLRVLADLAQDALIEIDMLMADLAADDIAARTRWNVVEARQLTMCLRELAVEAREAMQFQNLADIPQGVMMEFVDSLRRIKLLLVGAGSDEALAA